MADPGPLPDLLAQLRTEEHRLLHRHRVRLRVDKVTSDGRNALCTAGQVRSHFLRSDLRVEEIIAECHLALSSLHRIGISPLIGTVPRRSVEGFQLPDPSDPFLLRSTLTAAGLEDLLVAGFSFRGV